MNTNVDEPMSPSVLVDLLKIYVDEMNRPHRKGGLPQIPNAWDSLMQK